MQFAGRCFNTELIICVHGDKWGDIELFFTLMKGYFIVILLDGDKVTVSLSESVIDFIKDGSKFSGIFITIVNSKRIEDKS